MRKQISVDLEVYDVLNKKASEMGTTLSNAIRALLGMPVKPICNGKSYIVASNPGKEV
jgi:hypothetical protein